MKNYILKIVLDNTDIWRRITIPRGYTFSQLHEIIQILFGWENYHLHEFNAAGILIISDEGDDPDMITEKFRYESEVSLDLILLNVKTLTYAYDFGDGWELTIYVEETEAEGEQYPKMIEYGGNMAAEDCGGVYGLTQIEPIHVNPDELNLILKYTFED